MAKMQKEIPWNEPDAEEYEERSSLVLDRIREIQTEAELMKDCGAFFSQAANVILDSADIYDKKKNGTLLLRGMEECQADQNRLFTMILPENYKTSFANPAYSVQQFGKEAGQMISFLASELEVCIASAFQGNLQNLTLFMELFVQVYGNFREQDLTEAGQTIYWFFHDYSEIFIEQSIREEISPQNSFCMDILMNADLTDLRYLYQYGLPVGKNELEVAAFLNEMSEDEIQSMADTYTEGFRMGFQAAGKDLSKKKTVQLHYPIGFERMMRAAVYNFRRLGLEPVAEREAASSFGNKGRVKLGAFSTSLNRQYDFDHREDRAMYLDKAFVERKLEVMRNIYEKHKMQALGMAGPAVVEVFGQTPFSPESKAEVLRYDEKQQQLNVYNMSECSQISDQYMPSEEYSFTMIAYPIPEIGEQFPEIFAGTVELNTLDYKKYQTIQQTMINVLDQADQVHIKGSGKNRTDLYVQIYPLQDPDHQSAFENCVADVNIPVGEVFTSPVLKGTNGTLHVTEVYLNGLRYQNLELQFQDGMIKDYTCTNFDTDEENRNYIKSNVLMHHDTLPMGEFAIGTNTTAYRMARRFDIADKLPILIAEKTGPHFAVGDTCYSEEEDVPMYNPDGKEMVARENEVSRLRSEDPAKAYFNCHTDITIPYDELEAITVIRRDKTTIDVIRDGLFCLEGTEELNIPLKEN